MTNQNRNIMKKTILSLMALPLLLACSSDEQPAAGLNGRVPLQVELGGISRAAIDALPANCNYGVFVTSSSYASSTFVEDGFNRLVTYTDGKSTMDKSVYLAEGGHAYVWAYYPYNANRGSNALTAMPLETKSQTDFLVSDAHYANESQPRVNLTMRHALARIHVTLRKAADNTKVYYYKEMTLTDAYLSATYNFDGKYTIDAAMGDITAYTSNGNSSLQDGGVVEFDFLVLPTSNKAMSVYLPNGTIEFKTALPTRTYQAGQQYNITITINSQGELVVGNWTIVPWNSSVQNGLNIWRDNKDGEEKTDPTVPAEGEHEGHAYVDLGLPSGTLWATCNVGAEKPEDYGGYYSWGETETKEGKYEPGDYKWCVYTPEPFSELYTKYCTTKDRGYEGFTDGKTKLEDEDDAAHVNWGGKWFMPTEADAQELKSNCSVAVVTRNGVFGFEMTSLKNGKSIFFPKAGTMNFGYYQNCAIYNCSETPADNSATAYILDFSDASYRDEVLMVGEGGRTSGRSVRPVIHAITVIHNVVYN